MSHQPMENNNGETAMKCAGVKVYLAARYSRREELCRYREQLQAHGFIVTSRWLNGTHQLDAAGAPIGDAGEQLVESGDGREAAALRRRFCEEDVADVLDADVVISFTEEPRKPSSNRGGRHVEFGIALGMRAAQVQEGKDVYRLIVVGHRENIFHWLDSVEFYPAWQDVCDVLELGAELSASDATDALSRAFERRSAEIAGDASA